MKKQITITVSGQDFDTLERKASDCGCTPEQLLHRTIHSLRKEDDNIWNCVFAHQFTEKGVHV